MDQPLVEMQATAVFLMEDQAAAALVLARDRTAVRPVYFKGHEQSNNSVRMKNKETVSEVKPRRRQRPKQILGEQLGTCSTLNL